MSVEIYKVGELKLAVGVDWRIVSGKSKFFVKRNISAIVKQENAIYAAMHPVIHEGNSQFVLFQQFSTEVGDLYLGAGFLVDELRGCTFIKKLKSEDLSEDRYWIVSISSDGLVLENSDKIIKGQDLLEEEVNNITDLINLDIVTHEEDKQELEELFEINRTINDATFELFSDLETIKVKVYLKKEKKGLKVSIGITTAISLAIGGYIYFKDNRAYESISNKEHKVKFRPYDKKITDFKNANKKRKGKRKEKITDEEYFELSKKQIKNVFETQYYTNNMIINNIIELDKILPHYLVEWELTKFAYTKNGYLFIYSKIPNSIGVYSFLDDEILELSKNNNIHITPSSLESNGKKRIYQVHFDDNGRKDRLFRRLEEESNITSKMDLLNPVEKDIKKINGQIDYLAYSITNKNIFVINFTNAVEDATLAIKNHQKNLTIFYDNAIDIIEKKEIKTEIPSSYLDGDIMKHIELTQMLTIYNWNYPSSPDIYPKLKGYDYSEDLKPYAQSYEIDITPIEGLTDSFESMYDIANKIDSKNVIFKSVEYSVKNNEWAIKADLFETFK
jgi:hypothetical protein